MIRARSWTTACSFRTIPIPGRRRCAIPIRYAAGKTLWEGAPLSPGGFKASPLIRANCSDCHARDGRDLKYFSFSNASIIARSRFHGLSELQGQQIASYIRSLPVPSPGRPWNPPYQPGPGLDRQPVENWAAGAGLAWALDNDSSTLPFLFGAKPQLDWSALVPRITREPFRPGWQPERPRDSDLPATAGLEPLAASSASHGRLGSGLSEK